MATKDKRRLFETDLQMEMSLKRAADLYVESEEESAPAVQLPQPPHEEVVDRVIKKVRKL
ncbi:MAG: hypothetical protein PVF49_05475 [Anaerolineales bacterium]|jgi:hypothetical protein